MKTTTQTPWPGFQPVLAAFFLGAALSPGFGATSVQFSTDTFLADENQTPARIALQRSGDTTGAQTVTVTAMNGPTAFGETAKVGEDYLPFAASVKFAAGQTNQEIVITLPDDYFAEPDKTLQLVLTNLPAGVTSARPQTTLLIRDDDRPGSIDASWSSTLGLPPLGPGEILYADPRIVTRQPDGKLIVNVTVFDSDFTFSLYWRILRLKTDGTVDATFPVQEYFEQSNGAQQVVALADGKILVVEYVLPAGEGRLATRLNPDGSQDSTFTNVISGGHFEVIPLPDGKMLVHGFSSSLLLNGNPIPKLSRLNSEAVLDPTFTGPASLSLGELWPVSGGKVMAFAWGQSGPDPSKLYRLNPDGSLDNGFTTGTAGGTPNMIGSVVEQSDGKLVVGGVFQTFNGQVRNGIVRLNPNGSIDPNFQTGQGFGPDGQPYQLWQLPGDRILVGAGGGYTQFDGERVSPPIILKSNGRRDSAFDGTFINLAGGLWNASPSDISGPELYFLTGYGLGRLNTELALRIVSTERDGDGTTRLLANALIDRSYTFQASENLANWSDLATQVATTNRIKFTDSPTNSPAVRFFRLKSN
jgi:uncharacterized delta-60 repeat protein